MLVEVRFLDGEREFARLEAECREARHLASQLIGGEEILITKDEESRKTKDAQIKAQEPPLKKPEISHEPDLAARSIIILSNAAHSELARRFVAANGSTMAISQLKELCCLVRQQTLSVPVTMPGETANIVRNWQVLDSQKLATGFIQRMHLRLLVETGRELEPENIISRVYVTKIPIEKLIVEACPTIGATQSKKGEPSAQWEKVYREMLGWIQAGKVRDAFSYFY